MNLQLSSPPPVINYAFWTLVISMLTLILLGFSVVAQYLGLWNRKKPEFTIQKGNYKDQLIVRIRINDNSTIRHCRLFHNKYQFSTQDRRAMEALITPGSAANFVLPNDSVDRKGAIIVRDGKRKIGKFPIREIIDAYDF